jgi:hypothetical protein
VSEAQYACITPYQVDADCHYGEGKKLAEKIEPEIGEHERQDEEDRAKEEE